MKSSRIGPDGSSDYIIAQDSQQRESVAIRYLFEIPPVSDYILSPLGLSRFCWTILELRLEKVLTGVCGEIDIVAGPLSWADQREFECEVAMESARRPDAHHGVTEFLAAKGLAEQGGIAWPPALSYIVGVEVKCA
jgi:hypothetical protein